jgi:bifunctional enzyme CysN/CysC
VGEVAKLFVEAGIVVLCSFISPFRAERQMVRELVADDEFVEVFVDVPLEECIKRDPKGLYAAAMAGKIKNFTGIDSPYERPENPTIHLADHQTAEQACEQVCNWVLSRIEQV